MDMNRVFGLNMSIGHANRRIGMFQVVFLQESRQLFLLRRWYF